MYETIRANAQPMDKDDFGGAEYLEVGETVKIVVHLECAYYAVQLTVGDETYTDCFNDREPYDLLTHFWFVEKARLTAGMPLLLTALDSAEDGDLCYHMWEYVPEFADEAALLNAYDNGLSVRKTETQEIADGLCYRHILYGDKAGAPVHAFLLEIDSQKNTLYIGTPQDGYESVGVRATVPDMIDAAVRNGQLVLAATNADFFDMFGDGHPSGLCVKNGKVIANGDIDRPFIGVLRDGTPVVARLSEQPQLPENIYQAAAGLQMIVCDGKLSQWGPLEPFAYVRHPRTAAGVKKDGTILLLAVDGRIPAYSNGASLVDLAKLMLSFGADRAVNLDGGGSSVVYTKKGDEFVLRNEPADLCRPTEKLIREEYNSLLVVRR